MTPERAGPPSELDTDAADAVPTHVEGGSRPRPPGAAEEPRTLVDERSAARETVPKEWLGVTHDFDERYEVGETLGEGGMGEVRLCADQRIGRAVALKVIRADNARSARLQARFLFEARVQGQLEHPSIVPVYDLGLRPDGSAFFTMKRVRGKTLHEVLKSLRLGDRTAAMTFTRRRLLAAFQTVCLAIEFAHRRGIVHRDLKPSNIMLGELGEVSVLDWGLAKLCEADPSSPMQEGRPSISGGRFDATGVGEVLGTPGYMSPEQAIDSQRVAPPTDIFALGSILFELLTLHQLVGGKTHADVKVATVAGTFEPRISKRFPDTDVPPELEEICVRATALEPSDRIASARAIADAIERFLEGDLDVSRRRSMAGAHTRSAIQALAESVEAKEGASAREARSRALREVNRALALDPRNQTALRTLMRILTEVPRAAAPEAEAAIRSSEARAVQKAARRGGYAYLALSGNVALMALLGVVNPRGLVLGCACFLGASALAFAGARRDVASDKLAIAIIALSSIGIAAITLLFGAFVYAPGVCAANVVVMAAGLPRHLRWLALACGMLAIGGPLLAEHFGIIAPGWVFQGDAISIVPRAVRFPALPSVLLLGIANLGTVVFPALLVGAERDARERAERELVLRAHQLAELVPPEARTTASAKEPTIRVSPSAPPPPPAERKA